MKSRPASITVVNNETGDSPNTEELIKAVEDFDLDSTSFPDKLNDFLNHVAKTGNILASWSKVQKVFIHKLKLAMDEFYKETPYKAGKVNPNCENQSFEYLREIFIKQATDFESPPFTFQRLCELIQDPKQNYTKCEKFMRAIEKNMTVVSSWAYPPRRSETNGDENYNTPMKADYVPMTYREPQPALPPSPMLTSNHNSTVTGERENTNENKIVTNLSQALDEAEKEEEEKEKQETAEKKVEKQENKDDEKEETGDKSKSKNDEESSVVVAESSVSCNEVSSSTNQAVDDNDDAADSTNHDPDEKDESADDKANGDAKVAADEEDEKMEVDEVSVDEVRADEASADDVKADADKVETFNELHGEQVTDNKVMSSDIHGQHRPKSHASSRSKTTKPSTTSELKSDDSMDGLKSDNSKVESNMAAAGDSASVVTTKSEPKSPSKEATTKQKSNEVPLVAASPKRKLEETTPSPPPEAGDSDNPAKRSKMDQQKKEDEEKTSAQKEEVTSTTTESKDETDKE